MRYFTLFMYIFSYIADRAPLKWNWIILHALSDLELTCTRWPWDLVQQALLSRTFINSIICDKRFRKYELGWTDRLIEKIATKFLGSKKISPTLFLFLDPPTTHRGDSVCFSTHQLKPNRYKDCTFLLMVVMNLAFYNYLTFLSSYV
jgi:hypothetical protein